MDFEFGGFDSGFSDFDAELEEFQVKKVKKFDRMWRCGFGGSVLNSPLVHEDVIYFGCCDHNVYCFDLRTDKEIWRFPTGGIFYFSSPVIIDGTIYIGSYDFSMYAISLEGKEKWNFRTGGEIFSTPLIIDSTMYFGSKDSNVYAIDLDGNEIWRFKTGGEIACAPTSHDGKIYIGSFDGNIYCLSLEGKEMWRFRTGQEIVCCGPLRIHDGILYFGGMDNFLYSVNAETGKEIWRFPTGDYGNSSIPFVHEGRIYHGCRDGFLYVLNKKTGRELWRFKCDGGITGSSPVVVNGNVYVSDEVGGIYCITIEGKEVWKTIIEDGSWGIPAVWNGRIYYGSKDCHMYGFDLETGEILSKMATGTLTKSNLPPPYEVFEAQVKRPASESSETHESEKYDFSKEESKDMGSEYSVKSEYVIKSDYQ